MAQHRVEVSRLISAPAERIYAVIADYRHGHPRILPRPHFVSLSVDEGGFGAGTVISCEMRLWGIRRRFRAAITEPEPGRALVKTDLAGNVVTTFTVEPRDPRACAAAGGPCTLATITTDVKIRRGLLGKVEGWLITRLLRPIYVKELELLAAAVAENSP